jgi:RNA-directed DNA polymerase
MERQKQIAYQLDLFSEQVWNAIDQPPTIQGVPEGLADKVFQVTGAGEHERALTDNLMQHVCSSDNIRKAYKQVKQNKGTPGQQAIYQVLNPLFDGEFSPNSYGFREGHNAHQALRKSCEYIKGCKPIVVDIDLEKFFDRVNHDRLMHSLSQKIGDKILLRLVRKYLQCGILTGGLQSQRTEGTPQGSPLSPLLSNIVLDELDKELEKRGHQFCRYADDCNIYVRTQKSGERVMESIGKFIEDRLKLKINRQKSKVVPSGETKFLGYRIVKDGVLTISPVNINRLKDVTVECL